MSGQADTSSTDPQVIDMSAARLAQGIDRLLRGGAMLPMSEADLLDEMEDWFTLKHSIYEKAWRSLVAHLKYRKLLGEYGWVLQRTKR